jgi:hypothetical protein
VADRIDDRPPMTSAEDISAATGQFVRGPVAAWITDGVEHLAGRRPAGDLLRGFAGPGGPGGSSVDTTAAGGGLTDDSLGAVSRGRSRGRPYRDEPVHLLGCWQRAALAARAFPTSAGIGMWVMGARGAVLLMRARVRLRVGAGYHGIGQWAAIGLIRVYQREISSRLPPRCAHDPSCSDYAADAIGAHGLIRGGRRAVGRYRRCRLPERVR